MKLCNRPVDRYAWQMSRASRPLLACLRHRLAVCVWLCALLVLGKTVLSTACFTDGVPTAAPTTSSSMVLQSVSVDVPIAFDDESAPCWHAGATCHCACAHASPLPVASWLWIPPANAAVSLPLLRAPTASAGTTSTFRPPIA